MIIEYYLINPTGNITVLIKTPVPVEKQPLIAAKIMKEEPSAEQVGFISQNSLRMAGGEFCGNASMSAAAVFALENGIADGENQRFFLNVSGAVKPVRVDIECYEKEKFRCSAVMPEPLDTKNETRRLGGKNINVFKVDCGGIVHFITEEKIEKSAAEEAVKQWCDECGVGSAGIMFLDRENSRLLPLVYVSNPPTLFWESSCASGTASVGAYLAHIEDKIITVSLKEPGGTLTVTADPCGNTVLNGHVEIIKHESREI